MHKVIVRYLERPLQRDLFVWERVLWYKKKCPLFGVKKYPLFFF